MTMQDITEFLDNKILENENKIIITFYEIRVERHLTKAETKMFLSFCKIRLENLNYQVFSTGEEYIYENSTKIVETNELMVAIKNKIFTR